MTGGFFVPPVERVNALLLKHDCLLDRSRCCAVKPDAVIVDDGVIEAINEIHSSTGFLQSTKIDFSIELKQNDIRVSGSGTGRSLACGNPSSDPFDTSDASGREWINHPVDEHPAIGRKRGRIEKVF